MKRALLAAAVLLAASFTTARAADKGMDGHDLLKHCRESALSGGTYRDPWGRAFCLGFVTEATDQAITHKSGDHMCPPKQGVNYAIMTELFARYLINHPEKRDSLGVTLLTDTLQEAYPCKAAAAR
jgi:hypothetical protein